MTAFETAQEFFHACESSEGWQGCERYVSAGAPFSAQCEGLEDTETVEAYCEWMAALGKGPLAGCVYEIHSSSYDEANRTAVFFATLTATHVGEGGPVPPTNKQTKTDYMYALSMNDEGKVAKMRKVWNVSWTYRELGWD